MPSTQPCSTDAAAPRVEMSANVSEQYIYTPLNIADHGMSTRLLRILPELSSDGLTQCELVAATIECRYKHKFDRGFEHCIISTEQPSHLEDGAHNKLDRPAAPTVGGDSKQVEFWALSYVWGSEDDLRSITVKGLVHAIQSNLFDFLERARHIPDIDTDWAWIDALCINQSNVMERNYQVQHMGLIYSHAVGTISWLGSGLELLGPLHDFVMEVCGHMERDF